MNNPSAIDAPLVHVREGFVGQAMWNNPDTGEWFDMTPLCDTKDSAAAKLACACQTFEDQKLQPYRTHSGIKKTRIILRTTTEKPVM